MISLFYFHFSRWKLRQEQQWWLQRQLRFGWALRPHFWTSSCGIDGKDVPAEQRELPCDGSTRTGGWCEHQTWFLDFWERPSLAVQLKLPLNSCSTLYLYYLYEISLIAIKRYSDYVITARVDQVVVIHLFCSMVYIFAVSDSPESSSQGVAPSIQILKLFSYLPLNPLKL